MGSVALEASPAPAKRRKAMWLYPKAIGFNPSERWGHSSCFRDGVLYVFGGCCGGLHFSDVLALNLETMAWTSLATAGQRPGTRDSHSAALVGHSMFVFGGTNGSKKVNDLHILDIRTKEWSRPVCRGNPPAPRESHTATLVGDDKLVVFGGSGEGEANYLNDVHILDLKSMTWVSPEVKGDLPAPRDSHTAVAVGNKLFVYGGDCGDRYHGEVDVFDMDSSTWLTLAVQGSSPGVRAGHSAVSIGSKIYIVGGVGDKQYYSDVWVLDLATCAWSLLDTRGQPPQGRFSHTAVVTNTDIAIYGGCGEDERPLYELLILQLGSEHPNGRYNISLCKRFGCHWNHGRQRFLRSSNPKSVVFKNGEQCHRSRGAEESKDAVIHSSDNSQVKRRKVGGMNVWELDSEQEEHSLLLSQHSSPSQSDQEQNVVHKTDEPIHASKLAFVDHLQLHRQREQSNGGQRNISGAETAGGKLPEQLKTEQFLHGGPPVRQEVQFLSSDQKPSQEVSFVAAPEHKPQLRQHFPPLIGAEVRAVVDGAFDSGYLMTANVNGQILRGVLFAPGPGLAVPRPHSLKSPRGSLAVVAPQQCSAPPPSHGVSVQGRPPQPASGGTFLLPQCRPHLQHQSQVPARVVRPQPATRPKNDLQGVVLTLGAPGFGGCSGS